MASRREFSDFCILGAEERLSDIERVTLSVGGDLTKFLERITSQEFETAMRSMIESSDIRSLEEVYEYYKPHSASRTALFPPPQGIIASKVSPVHGLPDGEIVDISFASAFHSKHPQYESLQKTIPENGTVHARYWKHNEGGRTTIVAVHGVAMGDSRSNSLAFLPGHFYRLGFDIALFELPFHGRRLTPEFREVGHSLFPSGNLVLTNEAILHSVSDLRQLRLVLKALGVKRIGSMGVSLGSYLISLWSCFDPLDFLIPMVPVVSLSDIILKSSPCAAWSDEEKAHLAEILDIHSPLAFTPKTKGDAVFVVAGHKDVIVPRNQPELLARHFGSSTIHWFDGTHALSGDRAALLSELKEFLGKV